MPRRKSLSDIGVAALKPRAARYAEPDPELRGHYVRVQPSGAKSFVAVARDPAGKQVWATIGATDLLGVDDARIRARSAIERIRRACRHSRHPRPRRDTFGEVAANWMKRHVEANGLRSRREIELLLASHVLPVWGDREFLSIRRSDVAALLDGVEDDHGARQADLVLTIVRSMMNWFATRHDDYTPPIVRGMRRQDPKAQARTRILDDAEIRAIWHAAETSGTFGAILKTCLLTAQRSRKVATMRWSDLVDGEWTIPREPREKETAGTLLLPKAVLDIIRSQPRIGSNPFVFAGARRGAFHQLGPEQGSPGREAAGRHAGLGDPRSSQDRTLAHVTRGRAVRHRRAGPRSRARRRPLPSTIGTATATRRPTRFVVSRLSSKRSSTRRRRTWCHCAKRPRDEQRRVLRGAELEEMRHRDYWPVGCRTSPTKRCRLRASSAIPIAGER